MKNYEDMSDFEINSAVHNALLDKPYELTFHGEGKITWKDKVRGGEWETGIVGYTKKGLHDYCNNPADAWPIIVKNEIDVIQNNGQDCPLATNSAVMMFRGDDVFICQHENPLRAAMIVFLKMNEDKL